MANQNSPHGFALLGSTQSTNFSAQCFMMEIPSADTSTYAIGDAVLTAAAGGADAANPWGTFGIPQIQKMTAAAGIANAIARGVVIAMFRNPYQLDFNFVPASKAQNYYVIVHQDPYGEYEMQLDGSASYAGTMIGMNANYNNVLVQTPAAPGFTMLSSASIVASTTASTNTFPLKILSVAQRPNIATGLYVPLVVTWNTHELKTTTGTTTG